MSDPIEDFEYMIPFNAIKVERTEDEIIFCRLCSMCFQTMLEYAQHAILLHAPTYGSGGPANWTKDYTHMNYYDLIPEINLEIDQFETVTQRQVHLHANRNINGRVKTYSPIQKKKISSDEILNNVALYGIGDNSRTKSNGFRSKLSMK